MVVGRTACEQMISLLKNTLFLFILRLLIGGMFTAAGLVKIDNIAAFEQAILHYQLSGPASSTLIAAVLPWLEIVCGLCLIVGIFPRSAAFILTALLACFTLAVFFAMVRGLDISCGCFSQDPNTEKIGWLKIAENCGLLLLSAPLLFFDSEKYAIRDFLRSSAKSKKASS